jgi:anti-anti-sigma regulatory factor
MLRIERILTDNDTTLRAAGRLTGPWVAELRRTVAAEEGHSPILLDLTDVSFADHDGLAFLATQVDLKRVVLRCSPFLTEQLSTTTRAKSS